MLPHEVGFTLTGNTLLLIPHIEFWVDFGQKKKRAAGKPDLRSFCYSLRKKLYAVFRKNAKVIFHKKQGSAGAENAEKNAKSEQLRRPYSAAFPTAKPRRGAKPPAGALPYTLYKCAIDKPRANK